MVNRTNIKDAIKRIQLLDQKSLIRQALQETVARTTATETELSIVVAAVVDTEITHKVAESSDAAPNAQPLVLEQKSATAIAEASTIDKPASLTVYAPNVEAVSSRLEIVGGTNMHILPKHEGNQITSELELLDTTFSALNDSLEIVPNLPEAIMDSQAELLSVPVSVLPIAELASLDEPVTESVRHAQVEIMTMLAEHQPDFSEVQKVEMVQLFAVLPPLLQLSLAEHMATAAPEQVEAVEQLTLKIAAAADRLHILAATEQLDTVEAEKIEELLVVWYQSLAEQLGIALEPGMLEAFIAAIKDESYQLNSKTVEAELLEADKYRTSIRRMSQNFAYTFSQDIATLSHKLGRFTVQLSAI